MHAIILVCFSIYLTSRRKGGRSHVYSHMTWLRVSIICWKLWSLILMPWIQIWKWWKTLARTLEDMHVTHVTLDHFKAFLLCWIHTVESCWDKECRDASPRCMRIYEKGCQEESSLLQVWKWRDTNGRFGAHFLLAIRIRRPISHDVRCVGVGRVDVDVCSSHPRPKLSTVGNNVQ